MKAIKKSPEFCPVCLAEMIDDAWEIIDIDDRFIQLNIIYPAWVCSEFCGFYINIEGSDIFKND